MKTQVVRVQELRRSNAATAQQDQRLKRQRTRSAAKRNAIKEGN